MRFRVLWLRSALDELARTYLLAAESDLGMAVTSLIAQIDQVLAVNPQHIGESRADGERILIRSPLVLEYEVFDEAKVDVVRTVRYLP